MSPRDARWVPAGAMFNVELPSCNRAVEALESEPPARLYFGRTRDGLVDSFRYEDGVAFRRLLETNEPWRRSKSCRPHRVRQ